MQSPVTGRPLALLGGALCLDFVNTAVPAGIAGRNDRAADLTPESPPTDFLPTCEALIAWSAYVGAVDSAEAAALDADAQRAPQRAAVVHTRAIELRDALFELFRPPARSGQHTPALSVLNEELRRALADAEITLVAGRYHLLSRTSGELDRVIWPIARSAAELLISDDVNRVRQCDGLRCGWLFLDTSKAGRRRWCTMALCGNRAKARRYREGGAAASTP